MKNIESLMKRAEKLGAYDHDLFYRIDAVTDYSPDKPNLFRTLDEALQEVYNDARKHRVEYLHVMILPSHRELRGNFIGFSWTSSTNSPIIFNENEKKISFVSVFDEFGCGTASLSYPEEHPELELMNILILRADKWCKGAGYSSIEEWERKHTNEMNKLLPNGYESELEEMKRIYREAGYNVQ